MLARSATRQIAIWEIMVLVAGAAAGLGWVKVALKDFEGSGIKLNFREWWAWLILVYACVLGMTMAISGMLVVDRFRTGYRWRAGAMAWFVIGCLAWLLAALTAVDHLFLGPDPILLEFSLEGLTGGLHVGGILLFLTFLASGRAVRRWWRAAGWWPEWTGMWLLALMSIGGSVAVAFLILRIGL